MIKKTYHHSHKRTTTRKIGDSRAPDYNETDKKFSEVFDYEPYASFETAKEIMKSEGVKSQKYYAKNFKELSLKHNIRLPGSPHKFYASEWVSFNDFLNRPDGRRRELTPRISKQKIKVYVCSSLRLEVFDRVTEFLKLFPEINFLRPLPGEDSEKQKHIDKDVEWIRKCDELWLIDDYGRDCAWELGFATGLKKIIRVIETENNMEKLKQDWMWLYGVNTLKNTTIDNLSKDHPAYKVACNP